MLYENLKKYHIVLGSASPRRRYLLGELGLDFEVMTNSGLDERYPEGLSKEEIPVYLAELKADHLAGKVIDDALLITADTIVWMQDEVINKPVDQEDAFRMLKQLSGNMHEVLTGVCLQYRQRRHCFHASSLVWFAMLSDEEIKYYIELYPPLDKAGAYGIQDWIGYIGVEKIEGSYFNVMGLPLQRLYHELKTFLSNA